MMTRRTMTVCRRRGSQDTDIGSHAQQRLGIRRYPSWRAREYLFSNVRWQSAFLLWLLLLSSLLVAKPVAGDQRSVAVAVVEVEEEPTVDQDDDTATGVVHKEKGKRPSLPHRPRCRWWNRRSCRDDDGETLASSVSTTTKRKPRRQQTKTLQEKEDKKDNSRRSRSCRSSLDGEPRRQRFRDFYYRRTHRRVMDTAYRMAVLSSLAYIPFHKKGMHDDVPSNIRIVSGKDRYSPHRTGSRRRRLWKWLTATSTTSMSRFKVRVRMRRGVSVLRRLVLSQFQTLSHNKNSNNNHGTLWKWVTATSTSRFQVRRRMRQGVSLLRHLVLSQFETLYNNSNTVDESHGTASSSNSASTTTSDLSLQYWLYNWYEPTSVPGVRYHDTDVLVSLYNNKDNNNKAALVIAFAGTASLSDLATNVQTFEPARHSGFFHGGHHENNKNTSSFSSMLWRTTTKKNQTTTTACVKGSIHRGFLNAYARVERGHVLALSSSSSTPKNTLLDPLDRNYRHCRPRRGKGRGKDSDVDSDDGYNNTYYSSNGKDDEEDDDAAQGYDPHNRTVHRRRNGACRVRGEPLVTVLRELVAEGLLAGRMVHVTGHSLGGSLATLLALDMVINFPRVPVKRLYLWSFGAPHVVDDVFVRSALSLAPRLRPFVQPHGSTSQNNSDQHTTSTNGQFRRFVTVSDRCDMDFVSTVVEKILPSTTNSTVTKKWRRRAARRLGGVQGDVTHLVPAHRLWTPAQQEEDDSMTQSDKNSNNTTAFTKQQRTKSKTKSSVGAHSIFNYLEGISRESKDHPLSTDLPAKVRVWLEAVVAKESSMANDNSMNGDDDTSGAVAVENETMD